MSRELCNVRDDRVNQSSDREAKASIQVSSSANVQQISNVSERRYVSLSIHVLLSVAFISFFTVNELLLV